MKLAPSYTIILMGLFAEKFILPPLTNLSGFYLCFMEDIFLVGTELKLNLTNFSKISRCHPDIKSAYNLQETENKLLS